MLLQGNEEVDNGILATDNVEKFSMYDQEESEESLAKSYSRKVKEDTSYLKKNKKNEGERNDSADVLYNLGQRESYSSIQSRNQIN